MSRRRDSNPRPADYKSAALPTELHRQVGTQLEIFSSLRNQLRSDIRIALSSTVHTKSYDSRKKPRKLALNIFKDYSFCLNLLKSCKKYLNDDFLRPDVVFISV